MKSIDKLREAATYNPAFSDNATRIVCNYLSYIEAEIAERYMELPVDADGVPIQMGDTVEGELVFDDATAKGTVTTYHIHDNDEPDTVYIKVDCGNGTWTIKELRIKRCHHVNPRTLEDVLVEYAETIDVTSWKKAHDNRSLTVGEWEEIVRSEAEKYAAEIRELLGGDAE